MNVHTLAAIVSMVFAVIACVTAVSGHARPRL